jgi:U4/U6 small nuclear ribonucleoprotein PRP4
MHAVQYGEHTEAAQRAQKQHAEAVAAAEQRRKLRTMVVPTDGAEVKVWLRKLREPVTLFGEGPMERRERLRMLMTSLSDEKRNALLERVMQLEVQNRKAPVEKFFTEGPPELQAHRRCAYCDS